MPLFVTGGILIFVVSLSILIIREFGGKYRSWLTAVDKEPPQPELLLKKKAEIRRITFKKKGETGCIEVTPDGIVRLYQSCGGEISQATRLNDPGSILNLFKIVSETETAKIAQTGELLYELVIETDSGTQTIYITSNSGNYGQQMINTIALITGNIPVTASSSLPSGISFYPIATAQPTSATQQFFPSPSPGGSPAATMSEDNPFVCDFDENGSQGKPYRVSNVACTSEPSSAP